MSVREELQDLYQQSGGLLQAPEVVNWARENPESEIAKSLEWNDSEAAEQFRIQQVRRLIAIHVVSEVGVRQMVSLTIDRHTKGGGYREINSVLASSNMRGVLLADALAELRRIEAKYNALVELAAVWDRVKEVEAKTAARQARRGKSKRGVAKRRRAG